MTLQDVTVPQMGEGLQEVRVLHLHKQPGDRVRRDEILYSMETDKAVMEVESPHEGVLQEWLAAEGDVLPIGTSIARIASSPVEEAATLPGSAVSPTEAQDAAQQMVGRSGAEGISIPPRTRAYCKEKGISDEEMRSIPAATSKLMPSDVDRYLSGRPQPPGVEAGSAREAAAPHPPVAAFTQIPLTAQHRSLIYRLKRSAQLVIPAVIKQPVDWAPIQRCVDIHRAEDGGPSATPFQVFAFSAAQATRDHPRFRSTLPTEEAIREYAHVNLGIAVGKPDGQLTTAVIPEADCLSMEEFISTAREQIQRARDGEDQANEATQLLLTYMGSYGVVDGIPVLVAPAAAVLLIGATFEQNGKTLANLVLTFDHRLIQGIEAAEFLKSIAQRVSELSG